MEKFMLALDDVVHSMANLCEEWSRLDYRQWDAMSEGYPFHRDLAELTLLVMNWRDQLEEATKNEGR